MSIDRADLLRASSTLTGIDFVQVSPTQTEIVIFLQHDTLPPALKTKLAALSPSAFHITADGPVDPPRVLVVDNASPLPAKIDGRAVMRIKVAAPGGFGPYRLRIDSPAIDPFFNDIRFSFKAACDSDLDCRTDPRPCPEDAEVDFPVDYRARDFWSYRQALIDFASQRYPDWKDRLEADIGMMVLELIAATGDEFAYAQDRLAREPAIDTATQRRSLRHLARLVDYPLDDGAGAFAWIDVEATAAAAVPVGTAVRDAQRQLAFEIGKGLRDPKPPPLAGYAVIPARNGIKAYIWDENATCLEAGATSLTIAGAHAADLALDPAIDEAGRWVLLRTNPVSPDIPERRLVVRLGNDPQDGIDPLTAAPITRLTLASPTPVDLDLATLVLHGNLVPATAGKTRDKVRFRIGPADDPTDPDAGLPRAVERVGADSVLCYPKPGSGEDVDSRVKTLFPLEGSDETPLVWHAGPGGAMLPEIEVVQEGHGPWTWLPTLVGESVAGENDPAFTLEDGLFRRVVGFERFGEVTELVDYASNDGTTIRFGDDRFGMAPPEGAIFSIRYRLGNGSRTNCAADVLTVLDPRPAGVGNITNPLAASGGRDPEPADRIRVNAPRAFRAVTHRAVRPDDYARIAERIEAIQKAGAISRWTGSWPTMFVTPDPRDTTILSPKLGGDLDLLMNRVRQAGREVKVMRPRYADFDLEIRLCAAAGAYRGEVEKAALAALFGRQGDTGYFDPDNFTFGKPLSRAGIVAVLQAVPGVRAVEDMRVRRAGYFDWRPFVELALPVAVNELVRVANDRELPERGAVKLILEGGA